MPTVDPKRRIHTAALAMHDRGLPVVPCKKKKSIWKEWPTKRRTREELSSALSNGQMLDIGIAWNLTDWLDLEYDDGDAGEARVLELFDNKIPDTPTWTSERGKHRLFRKPEGLPNKAVVHLNDIEFRIGNGKGALSILPPSAGRKWLPGLSLNDLDPAELPETVVEKLRATSPQSPKPTDSTDDSEKIPLGKRNDTLFAKACALAGVGLKEDAIAAALLELNQRLCDPPLPDDEVAAIAKSAASGETKPKVGFLARLLGDIELWHDDNDDRFATLSQGEHKENWKIGKRCRSFRRWLCKLAYDATGQTMSESDIGEICSLLEGKAVFDGPKHKLYRRVAEHEGTFYLDLCDEEWQAVEIDGKGWRVVSDPPVKFFRARAMQSLPVPIRPKKGESLKSLLCPFLNLGPTSWPLIGGWLVSALRPRGPYPVLKLLGEQGSAKTTTARALRQLVDPNAAPVRAEPRSTRDLMIAANNAWVICLDNLSCVKADLSDALCRISTGGGFSTRTLYTDEEESIFEATRPSILTSIEEIATRSDLLERSLIVELPTIKEAKRRAEKQFWKEFEKVRPRILGALLDAVSGAIRHLPEIERKKNPELSRLADFEQWAEAAELGLRLEPGEFVEAYRANREAATHVALESSPVVSALLRVLKKKTEIEATATQLLDTLGWVDSEYKRQPGWPRTARVLSQILKRVAPNLRQIGISAVQDTRGGGNSKEKVWRICGPTTPSSPVRPSESKLVKKLKAGVAKGRKVGSKKSARRPKKTRKK